MHEECRRRDKELALVQLQHHEFRKFRRRSSVSSTGRWRAPSPLSVRLWRGWGGGPVVQQRLGAGAMRAASFGALTMGSPVPFHLLFWGETKSVTTN